MPRRRFQKENCTSLIGQTNSIKEGKNESKNKKI